MIDEQSVPKKGFVYKLTINETSILLATAILVDKSAPTFVSFSIPAGNYANETLALLKGLDQIAPCIRMFFWLT